MCVCERDVGREISSSRRSLLNGEGTVVVLKAARKEVSERHTDSTVFSAIFQRCERCCKVRLPIKIHTTSKMYICL